MGAVKSTSRILEGLNLLRGSIGPQGGVGSGGGTDKGAGPGAAAPRLLRASTQNQEGETDGAL
jgi:hypothetical protein